MGVPRAVVGPARGLRQHPALLPNVILNCVGHISVPCLQCYVTSRRHGLLYNIMAQYYSVSWPTNLYFGNRLLVISRL
jgi:hypothetical protein